MHEIAVRRLAARPVRPAGWWFDASLVGGFVVLTATLAAGGLLGLDLAVRDWCNAHRPDAADGVARAFNLLGQGGKLLTPLSLVLAVAVAWKVRSIRPLLVVALAFLLTYVTIGPLKVWTDRAAPSSTLPDPVELFNHTLPAGEYGRSYPSGHVVNAIVWYGVIALLLSALLRAYADRELPPALYWTLRIVPPAIVFVTTTYLSFHWITDSVAGLLLGLFLDRLLARVPWDDLPLPRRLGEWAKPALFTGPG
ncbi:MAG TPA: phosphatase PAP2 family protein [Micromonosporaceae bacterium]